MLTQESLVAAWNGFFHTPESTLTLCVFRILFGILLTLNAILMFRERQLWFGPEGVFPCEDHRRTYGRFMFTVLSYLPPTKSSVTLLMSLHLTASMCLGLGLCTRLSATVVFVTLVSIHHRNYEVTHSGDTLLRLMSFLLIFSPAGQSLSLDRLLLERFNGSTSTVIEHSPWCLRLMQLQMSFLYFRAFSEKIMDPQWVRGTAAYYTMQTPDFRRFRLPAALDNLFFARVATWGTLAVELALSILVWFQESRYLVLVLGVLMHLGFEVFMNLQLFGVTMIVCLVVFIPPSDMERLLHAMHVF